MNKTILFTMFILILLLVLLLIYVNRLNIILNKKLTKHKATEHYLDEIIEPFKY